MVPLEGNNFNEKTYRLCNEVSQTFSISLSKPPGCVLW
ncbi:hypothetical protein CICLE_v100329472mg, partial [Citrus x clementina]